MLRKTLGRPRFGGRGEHASMRPQRNAAENHGAHPALGAAEHASMRPQRNAAENYASPVP